MRCGGGPTGGARDGSGDRQGHNRGQRRGFPAVPAQGCGKLMPAGPRTHRRAREWVKGQEPGFRPATGARGLPQRPEGCAISRSRSASMPVQTVSSSRRSKPPACGQPASASNSRSRP